MSITELWCGILKRNRLQRAYLDLPGKSQGGESRESLLFLTEYFLTRMWKTLFLSHMANSHPAIQRAVSGALNPPRVAENAVTKPQQAEHVRTHGHLDRDTVVDKYIG